MTRTVTSQAFVEQAADILKHVGEQTVFIEREGKRVAAIIPIDEYRRSMERAAPQALSGSTSDSLDDSVRRLRLSMTSISDEEMQGLLRELDSHRDA